MHGKHMALRAWVAPGATPETAEAGDTTPAGEGQPVETLKNRTEGTVGTAPPGSSTRPSGSARMEPVRIGHLAAGTVF